jgi:NAD(P)-dependent dehydrogenase (short-subunit alcohol dehydrogenase family)
LGTIAIPVAAGTQMSRQVLEGLTKSIAIELATKQIRVNTVCPTFIETPTRRFRRMEEVVGAVVFLASPAASLITGTSLMVDGGWTAQ